MRNRLERKVALEAGERLGDVATVWGVRVGIAPLRSAGEVQLLDEQVFQGRSDLWEPVKPCQILVPVFDAGGAEIAHRGAQVGVLVVVPPLGEMEAEFGDVEQRTFVPFQEAHGGRVLAASEEKRLQRRVGLLGRTDLDVLHLLPCLPALRMPTRFPCFARTCRDPAGRLLHRTPFETPQRSRSSMGGLSTAPNSALIAFSAIPSETAHRSIRPSGKTILRTRTKRCTRALLSVGAPAKSRACSSPMARLLKRCHELA